MSLSTAPLPSVQLLGAVVQRRYRLTRPIGQGGMGVVYGGETVDSRQPVALKLLRPELLGEDEVVKRFLEEGLVAQRIVHPNVLRIFESGRAEDGTPFLAMELLDGSSLQAHLRASGRMAPAQAVPIVLGILAGLGAAHAMGVVHRDLKPDNVILARDPSGTFVPKVVDFGIAKVMDAAGGMGNQTRTGVLLGTPAYMSPEQIRNAKDVDLRTDLWAVGVMFYEMVTGRSAFPAPTEFARLASVLGTQPDPLVSVDPALAPFAPVVERALHKDRNQRFQSADEMARALAHAAAAAAAMPGSHPAPNTPIVMPAPVRDSHAPFAAGAPVGPTLGSFESTKPSPHHHHPAVTPAGGTLASPSSRPSRASHAPPQIVVVDEDPAARSFAGAKRGVSPLVVLVLVVLALGAGFLLGFAVARGS
jgi:serine/threonine-protein kinase